MERTEFEVYKANELIGMCESLETAKVFASGRASADEVPMEFMIKTPCGETFTTTIQPKRAAKWAKLPRKDDGGENGAKGRD